MKKNIDDIVPPEDRGQRSIRKVSVDRTPRRRKMERVQVVGEDSDFSPPEPPRTRRRSSSRFGLWIIASVSIFDSNF